LTGTGLDPEKRKNQMQNETIAMPALVTMTASRVTLP
jgi:hypothetical protein